MTAELVIAGGGPAAVEAALTLQSLELPVTLVTPDDELAYRPLSVSEPFAESKVRRYKLSEILGEGAKIRHERLASVDRPHRVVRCESGAQVPYDQLLIALGARAEPGIEHAITFAGVGDVETLHGLVQDVEAGYAKRIAFVAPAGATWTLPLYELALQMAARVADMSLDVELQLATHEKRPMEVFGTSASDLVEERLRGAGITLHTGAQPSSPHKGGLRLQPGEETIEVGRIVAVHIPKGPGIEGLPSDRDGFLPVDANGRVQGLDDVWAAGDVTNFHLKQGGLATQQANAAAVGMARAVGHPVEAEPFEPTLRGVLFDGKGSWYLRRKLDGSDEGEVSRKALWWPPTKIAGRHLAVRLDQIEPAQTIEERYESRPGIRRRGFITPS